MAKSAHCFELISPDRPAATKTVDWNLCFICQKKKMMNKQRIQILRNIVEQLKPNYRELVKLRYFKEYSYEEISVELEIPIGTVKAQLFRSREQLFKILSGKKDTF